MSEEKPKATQPNNPLHGITLKVMLERLVNVHGWKTLHEKTNVNCFINNPTMGGSLKFLRKTPWARKKVELLYLRELELEKYGKVR